MSESEQDRQRLARNYADMSDEALLELAVDALSLTEVARTVLRAEFSARSLEIPATLTENPSEQEAPRAISGPLVMVKRFRDMPEAKIAESLLDSAGIDCFLADENIVRLDWFWSNLMGGFKLMVRPDDLAEAQRLLEEANVARAAESSSN